MIIFNLFFVLCLLIAFFFVHVNYPLVKKSTKKVKKIPKELDLISAFIVPKYDKFNGYDLLQALTICDLSYDIGEQIFHKYNSKNERIFSLACASEAGTFNMIELGSSSYDGVVMFFKLSDVVPNTVKVLDIFLQTLEQLKYELDGVIVDSLRKPIEESKISYWFSIADKRSQQFGTLDMFDGA